MVQHLLQRTGAVRIALIPADVLDALNEGLVPTVHLNEFLALDLARLAANVARQIGLDADAERLQDTLAMLGAFAPMRRHFHVARALYDMTIPLNDRDRDRVANALATHPSDVARSWAAQWVSFAGMDVDASLRAVRRFATDPHFGAARRHGWRCVSKWAGTWTAPSRCCSHGCMSRTQTCAVSPAS